MQLAAATQHTALGARAVGQRQAACRPCSAPPRPVARQQRAAAPCSGGSSSSARGRGRLVVTAAVKVQKGKQMLCSKTLKAKTGQEEQVQELCKGVADFSRQRIADRSSGVLAYEFSQDDYEAGTFHFLELYASQTSMTEHNDHPEIAQFVEKVQDLLEGRLGMALYEYRDGILGPAGMEGDVKGEGGLDDATGTNKFGGGASMKQSSSVVDLTKISEKDDEDKGLWGIKFKLPAFITGKKK